MSNINQQKHIQLHTTSNVTCGNGESENKAIQNQTFLNSRFSIHHHSTLKTRQNTIKSYLNSPETGSHDLQKSALRLTPKNNDVVHLHQLLSSVAISIASAKALRLIVSSSSLRMPNFRRLTEEDAARGEDGGEAVAESRWRRGRRSRIHTKNE